MSSSFQSCAYEGKKMKRFMKECMAVLLAGTMMLGTSYDIDVQVIWDKIEEGTLKIGGIVTKKRSQDVTSDTEKKFQMLFL